MAKLKDKEEIKIKKSNLWTILGVILGISLYFIFTNSGGTDVSYEENQKDYCGNLNCSYSESCSSCPIDCGECPKKAEAKIEQSIVWIKYEVSGKDQDGSYFENGGTGSGVITSNKDNELTIYTNRHVIDCEYNDINCYQRISEKIEVRTQDGNIHPVERVSFSKSDIDLAILTIKTPNSQNYPFAYYTENFKINDGVIAVGYPSYAQNVVEFSVSKGRITNIKEVLSQSSGKGFKVIESDAYTYFGSSGGGLFDDEGNLIGINTWLTNQESVAIDFSSIEEEGFVYCPKGSYSAGGKCYSLCERNEVMGDNRRCYEYCGKDFYCDTSHTETSDPRCQDSGYVLGTDNYCHQSCGSGYCSQGNYCFNNKCISCSAPNTYLFKDGTCRLYQ